jgi:hypothetical protein
VHPKIINCKVELSYHIKTKGTVLQKKIHTTIQNTATTYQYSRLGSDDLSSSDNIK